MKKIILLLAFLMTAFVCEYVSASDKPEIFVQLGHQDSVRFASFSADGKYMVTASSDRTVKLWDVGSGSEVRSFAGHAAKVTAAAVSSDGRLIVSGDEEGIIKIWDTATGRQLKNIINSGEYKGVMFLAFSPNDKVFSSISIGKAAIWNASTGQLLRTVEMTSWLVGSVAAGETFIAARDKDDRPFTSFLLVEMATGKEKLSLNYENHSISGVSFSRDGRYGLFKSYDYNAKQIKFEFLDMPENKKIAAWGAAGDSIGGYNIALSPDGKYALTVGTDGKGVTLWDAFAGKKIRQVTTSFSTYAAFSPDGRSFITLGNYVPTLWDVSSGNIVRSFAGRSLSLNSSAWLGPDGWQAIVFGNPNPPFLMDTATGEIKKVFSGYSGPSFIDNNRLLMVDNERKKIVLWDMAEGKVAGEVKGVAVYYSKDKKYMAEKMSDKELKVWEVASGKEVMSYTETSGALGGIRISADSKSLLLSGKKSVKMIDIETGVEGRSFYVEDGEIIYWTGENVKTSADGRYLVVKYQKGSLGDLFAGKNITIWEIGTGRKIGTIADVGVLPGSFDLSPDGKTMAVILQMYKEEPAGEILAKATGQKTVRLPADKMMLLYETATGKKIRTFAGIDKDIALFVFSSNGKYLFSGNESGGISQWDVSSGRKIKFFAGHKSGIQTIEESPDGKRLITCGNDGPVRFLDIESGNEIAQLVTFTDGEWIVITPEGYFNASTKGAKYLNVRIGNNVYSIDNFYEKFFNPVYVASVLQGKKIEAVADIRKGILPPPDVRISSPEPNTVFSTDTISITVSAKDTGGGIDEIRLYHNGKAIGEDQRAVKIVPKGNETIKTYTVSLVDGLNNFRAVGLSKDRTESNPYELTVKLTAPSKDVSLYILAVGINKYKNPALNLNYAEPDAKGIANFFRQKGKGLFQKVEIIEIYNEQATKGNIISKLNQLQATHPQDAVLLYLAGHGENVNDKWYLIPHELTYPEREDEVKTKGLSSDELAGYIKDIKAQKILMLLDACKSGAVLVAFRGFEDRKALSQLSRSTGVHIIAASTKDQFAAEVKDLGHGVFTYILLEGLKGKAAGGTETVTVRKLMGYVEEQLPDITKKYKQESQFPVVDSRGMDFPLVLTK